MDITIKASVVMGGRKATVFFNPVGRGRYECCKCGARVSDKWVQHHAREHAEHTGERPSVLR